jgi:charged multivesicular body protein 2A
MGGSGSRVPPEEKLKRFRQDMRRAVLRMERERTRLLQSENKMKLEMKRLAAKGETDSVMIICKDVVRNRRAMQQFLKLKSQLEALGLRIETVKAQSGIQAALKGAAGAMHQLNQITNVPQMQAIVQKFMAENELMDMKAEMLDDSMNDIWVNDGLMEEETADAYARVLGEMGITVPAEVVAQMTPTPARN